MQGANATKRRALCETELQLPLPSELGRQQPARPPFLLRPKTSGWSIMIMVV